MLPFSYSAVERALAAVYGASADAVRESAFRARVSSLQRLNILGAKARVGKGQRLTYGVPEIERLLCCLELCELGISTTTVGKLVNSYWADKFGPIFRAAQKTVIRDPSDDDVILVFFGITLMSGNWSEGSGFPGVPNVNHCTLGKLPDRIKYWLATISNNAAELPPRVTAVNLSARLRQFHTALGEAHMAELRIEFGGRTSATKSVARKHK